jgi:hypothetical protein
LNRAQKDQLFDEEARLNALHVFHDLHRCHNKGRAGSPSYDSAGFQLDYNKVADWFKPKAYNKQKMISSMDRALAKGESEEAQMFKLFFEQLPKKRDDIPHSVKDYVKDQVSKDIDVPWHQIGPKHVKTWRDKGFKPVKFEDWWKKPTAEEGKRMMKMMGGASLRKDL